MSEPVADPLIGKVLDERYEIDGLIGEGGMAVVFSGRQLSIGRRVAIKVIRPEYAEDSKLAIRFRREVEAVSRLRSPHVIEFHDFGRSSDGLLFIVMEYLEGQSLGELLDAEGPMTVGDVITIVRQVCAALGEAHAAGVLHRDLSPANIFICDVPSPMHLFIKLLDFGLAKVTEGAETNFNVTSRRTTVGTPAYISPEAVTAGKDADSRSDLYSLAVVVFEMLVGRLPYAAERTMEVALAHATAPIPSVLGHAPHLPKELDSFFQIALAKSPDDRFQDSDTLAQALATMLGDRRQT